MEKYKNILREVKKAFPGAASITVIVHTSTMDRIEAQMEVDKTWATLEGSENFFSEKSEYQSLRGFHKTYDAAQFSFDGRIFVTDKNI